jgi:hypothetical protein
VLHNGLLLHDGATIWAVYCQTGLMVIPLHLCFLTFPFLLLSRVMGGIEEKLKYFSYFWILKVSAKRSIFPSFKSQLFTKVVL